MIGIIGAMEEEVANIKNLMSDIEIIEKANMSFVKGKIDGKELVVVRSGIGKVNAGICTQILADIFAISVVINTGIAGAINNNINIGDIVVSTDAIQTDMDATAFGYELGQIPRMEMKAFPADEKLIELAVQKCKEVNPDINIFKGRISTMDKFVAGKEIKKEIEKKFNAFCTEMEGAAIAQAAYLNNIKFLIIRAISDKADGSAGVDYVEFEKEAIKHCTKLTLALINSIQIFNKRDYCAIINEFK